jgi:DNA-binding HxlR family transcriptional regulator
MSRMTADQARVLGVLAKTGPMQERALDWQVLIGSSRLRTILRQLDHRGYATRTPASTPMRPEWAVTMDGRNALGWHHQRLKYTREMYEADRAKRERRGGGSDG